MRLPLGPALSLGVLAILAAVLSAGSSRSNSWKIREARFSHQVAACVKQGQARLPAGKSDDFTVTNKLVRYPIGNISNINIPKDVGQTQNLDIEGYLKVIVDAMLMETAYAGHFTLNEIPDPNSINIYFLDCDVSATVHGFRNSNCAYVGYVNSIVCRTKAIEDQFALMEQIPRAYDVALVDIRTHVAFGPSSPAVLNHTRKMLNQSMITWMVGHELGHAVLHKAVVSGTQEPLHFNFFYSEVERQADDFVATKLASNEGLLAASTAGLGISEFIHQQYRIILKERFPEVDQGLLAVRDLPTVVPLEFTVTAGNYPLLLRAIGVRRAIAKANLYEDGTGYPTIVANNVIAHSAEPPTQLRLALEVTAGLFLIGALAGSEVLRRREKNLG